MQTNKNKKLFAAEWRLGVFIILLVCIVAITGVFTYQNINKIITDVEKGADVKSNATTLKQINNDLLILESKVRSFFFTRDTSYITRYDSSKNEIYNQVVILKANKNNNILPVHIKDSVNNIVNKKFVLFDEWISLAHNLEVVKKLSLIPQKLEDPTYFEDVSKIKNKRKREKLLEESNKVSLDEVKEEIEKAKRDQTVFLKDLDESTLILNQQNNQLTASLINIINVIEKEEKVQLAQSNTKAIQKARFTNFVIAVFCISSIVLLFFISFVFYKYVKAANAYNIALKNARIEAEALALAKQNFLANMTHELRTPINSIIGFSELLERSALNTEQHEQLGIVKKSSIHLLKVVNEVLDYSKLQAGKFSFEKIIFEPEVTIEEVVEILKPQADKKNIKFRFLSDKNIPENLIGDPFRLQQILLNIVGNAIKFTGSGSVIVSVRSNMIDDKACILNIEVKDTGIGIPDEYASKVFDEFEQADNKIDSKYRGTGLGLSISKKLIELQNGSINMYSKVGEGTMVNIIIPYQLATELDKSGKAEEPLSPRFLKGKKIMVVDDEIYNRMLLKKIFSQWGLHFYEAENGKHALELLETGHWDLLLMDIRMPEMSGMEATRLIRSSSNNKIKDIPVIALTASNDKEKEEKCLQAGMNSFISKPFSEQKLLKVLKHFLDKGEYDLVKLDDLDPEEEMNHNTSVNIDELVKSSNGDKVFVKEMINIFINSTSDGIEKMKKAYYDSKYEIIKEQAHKISSPCRHVGAYSLLSHLKNIENSVMGNAHPNEILNEIQLADSESQKVFDSLRLYI